MSSPKPVIEVGDEITYSPEFKKLTVGWTDGHTVRGDGERCKVEDIVGIRRDGKLVWVTGISGRSVKSCFPGHGVRLWMADDCKMFPTGFKGYLEQVDDKGQRIPGTKLKAIYDDKGRSDSVPQGDG